MCKIIDKDIKTQTDRRNREYCVDDMPLINPIRVQRKRASLCSKHSHVLTMHAIPRWRLCILHLRQLALLLNTV